LRVGNGGRVKADLVSTGVEQTAHVVDGAHPTADGEGDEHLRRHRLDDVQDDIARIAGGGDVKKGEFVSALFVVARGNFNRVACITQFNEIDAFDHATAGNVKTGNDALGQHDEWMSERW